MAAAFYSLMGELRGAWRLVGKGFWKSWRSQFWARGQCRAFGDLGCEADQCSGGSSMVSANSKRRSLRSVLAICSAGLALQ